MKTTPIDDAAAKISFKKTKTTPIANSTVKIATASSTKKTLAVKRGYSVTFDDSEEEGKCDQSSKRRKASAGDNYPEDVPVCRICGVTPCDRTEYSEEVMEHIDSKLLLSSDGTH
jgi:hypothetical protein